MKVTITNSFFDECEKTKWMYRFNNCYKPVTRPFTVGNMTYLYYKYGRPKTTAEFYKRYITDLDERETNTSKKGRTEEYLWNLAETYRKNCDLSIPTEMYFKNLVFRLFTQTINGHHAEEMLMNLFNAKSKTIHLEGADFLLDTSYGVDLVGTRDNVTFYIQVKPYSFIASQNPDLSLKKDRIAMIEKRDKALKDYGNETYYVFYRKKDDGNFEWLTKNSKLTNKLETILDKDGNSIFNHENIKWQ